MANPDAFSGCAEQIGGLILGIGTFIVGTSAAREIVRRIRLSRGRRRTQQNQEPSKSPEFPGYRRLRAVPPRDRNRLN